MKERVCFRCPLGVHSKGPVWGDGSTSAKLWLIGEAPGKEENESGIPFVGKAGQEMVENYMFRNGIKRENCYITNLVKCRPPDNRDPEPEEIEACRAHLREELAQLPPDAVIATLGRFSSQELLGYKPDFETVHGIPQRNETGQVIVPCYHPAAALYESRKMTDLFEDFRGVSMTVKGVLKPEDWQDPIPEPSYLELLYPRKIDTEIVAVDTESVGDRIWSIQICLEPGVAWFIKADNYMAVMTAKAILESGALVILHNSLHDLPMLAQLDIHPKRYIDTMLMANLLQSLPRGLKPLAYRIARMKMQSYQDLVYPYTQALMLKYLIQVNKVGWPRMKPEIVFEKGKPKVWKPQSLNTKIKRIFGDYGKNPDLDLHERWMNQSEQERAMVAKLFGWARAATIADIPYERAIYYACRDADATFRVYPYLAARIKAEQLDEPLRVDCGIVPSVAEMMQTGMLVDREQLLVLGQEYDERKERVAEEIRKMAGWAINPGSADQIAHLLYKQFGLQSKKKTKGGKQSTSDEALQKLKDAHEVVPKIINYRELQVMKENFVENVITNIAADNRVHTDLSMIRVVTGRFASKNPNLLAFPQPERSTEGKPLRDAFIAAPGCVLLSLDYSQIELRVLAHDSGEKEMIRIFHGGGDIHRETAALVFHTPIADVTEAERYAVKQVNFGIPYGISDKGLYGFLGSKGWTLPQCANLINTWMDRFSGVRDYMKAIRLEAKRFGFVRDMFGRKRLIPEARSTHIWIVESGMRQAMNAPIQMGAQGIMKRAMLALIPVLESFRKQGHYIRFLLQIHDDLIFEVDERILPWIVPIIKEVMETAVPLLVPVLVDIKVGKRWGSMEKYK